MLWMHWIELKQLWEKMKKDRKVCGFQKIENLATLSKLNKQSFAISSFL